MGLVNPPSGGGGTDPGALQKASNLSDLVTPATARTNLGLGTAATQASGAFDAAGAAAAAAAASQPLDSDLTAIAALSTTSYGRALLALANAAAADWLVKTGRIQVDAWYGTITTDSDGSTVTFDLSTSNKHQVTLAGNRTLALSNEQDSQGFLLILKQDGTGSRTVTWWAGILWAGGSAPVLTTAAGQRDVFSFIRISSGVYLGMAVLNF